MSSKLLTKFTQKLFNDSTRQQKFIEAINNPQSFSSAILWCQPKPDVIPFQTEASLPWQPPFVDRLSPDQKPGQHPWHDQGYFYCLDFSSVFAASVLLNLPTSADFVFDMCASPGGKSIFAKIALQPKLLASNEVIGKRMGALISNFKRCHIQDAIALSLHSSILAQQIPKTADIVMVDAPCTGQSLLVKGIKNPGCFHPVTINKNANRQKRILASSAQVVSPQGYLAYMTCAYSPEENEQVSAWFLERFPQFKALIVPHLQPYQSHLTDIPCYRMFPFDQLGAGAFTILFQNTEGAIDLKQQIPPEFLQQPKLIFF